jgi:hypothetical protein
VRYALFIARMIFYAFVGLASLAVLSLLIWKNWEAAAPQGGARPSRLTWHAIAKRKIHKWAKLKEDDVTWTLARIREGDEGVPKRALAVGRYAADDIVEGAPLRAELLSEFPLAEAPDNGAVMPVDVKTEHAASLKPGMRVAFLNDKALLPRQGKPGALARDQGFTILCVTTSAKDESLTTLSVQIPPGEMKSLQTLGSGQWRPIVLGALKKEEPVRRTAKARARGRAKAGKANGRKARKV